MKSCRLFQLFSTYYMLLVYEVFIECFERLRTSFSEKGDVILFIHEKLPVFVYQNILHCYEKQSRLWIQFCYAGVGLLMYC